MKEIISNDRLKIHSDKELTAIRDLFAGKAMQALIGDPRRSGTEGEVAEFAYVLADAMMKERAKCQ
jgi:hypothetical protein